jgi:hypothetical protein
MAGCDGDESSGSSGGSPSDAGTGGSAGADAATPPFPGSVWTVTETRRLLRSAPPESSRSARIAAARDEWESFQIFLRADTAVGGVDVAPGSLVGPDGFVIGPGEMALFRQHQMEISVGTYRNESFVPGWYPDPLIPFELPTSASQLVPPTYHAVPFDLPADETHGFWVDVHVPVDAPAGAYTGTFVVSAGEASTPVDVELTVWDFTLPRAAALKTALGWPPSRMRRYYEERAAAGIEPVPEDWEGVDRQSAELLSRHRINCRPPSGLWPAEQPDGSYVISSSQVEAVRAFADAHHVNAYSVPHPDNFMAQPSALEIGRWLAAWDDAIAALDRPEIEFYIYLRDEPNDAAAYDYVRSWGAPIVAAQSDVRVLVTEQTTPQDAAWGDLYGAVDLWVPLFPLFDPASAASRQALGETIWAYTALCQREETPWWHIDQPLLNYRAPAWIAWSFGLRGLLYWGGMSYWYQVDDPWTDAATLVRDGSSGDTLTYNGEGTLVYPGRAVGYDGIVASLRLKALRDSIEDYEYLAILERSGHAASARSVVESVVASWFDWTREPAAYEQARAELAQLIVDSR